jgi:hypothetical protein
MPATIARGGLSAAATSHRNDLQAECSSLPVENGYGKQIDTTPSDKAQEDEGQDKIQIQDSNARKGRKIRGKTQVLGYVPNHIVNPSLEEIKLVKHVEVGVASPIQVSEAQVSED